MAVFPAASTPTDGQHSPNCACIPCTDRLVADIRRPLVEPAPRVDRAIDRRNRS